MLSKTIALGILAGIVTSAVFSAFWFAGTASAQTSMEPMKTTVVRDSALFVGPKTLPPGDFIHLYDTTPYMIMNGHVAAKLPCDANYETPLHIMVGQAPDLQPAELELVKELSKPGKLCLYHADLASEHGEDVAAGSLITDIALHNPTSKSIRLPSTASVVIGVNEIMPGAESHEEKGH
ncbi:hypothetical protein [Nitrososphaera sp.]|uniref:hypothetical protein n=1 Tax=Nitrososphaera sp. TaxID=1971748 RepID=UPI00307EC7F8